jgi:hypothetical protein
MELQEKNYICVYAFRGIGVHKINRILMIKQFLIALMALSHFFNISAQKDFREGTILIHHQVLVPEKPFLI